MHFSPLQYITIFSSLAATAESDSAERLVLMLRCSAPGMRPASQSLSLRVSTKSASLSNRFLAPAASTVVAPLTFIGETSDAEVSDALNTMKAGSSSLIKNFMIDFCPCLAVDNRAGFDSLTACAGIL